MCASNLPCSQSPVRHSPVPRLLPRTVTGLMLLLTVFGVVVLNVPSLTFLTPMLHETDTLFPPATENTKHHIRTYEQRVRDVEHGSFTPLVMFLTGGLGNAATVCYKRLASLLSSKQEQPYCSTMAWIRCSLSFSLLCSSIQCIKGAHSAGGRPSNNSIDLVSTEAKISSSFVFFSEPSVVLFPLYRLNRSII